MEGVKMNRCNQKTVAFVIGIVMMIVLLALFLLVAIKGDVLRQCYYFNQGNKVPSILFLVSTTCLELTCILLIVGLLKNNLKLVFAWLIIMTLFWNINLVISIISIINFIVIKKISTVPFRSLSLLAIQAIWLVLIGIVYCYWRSLTDIRDLPSLLEYFERKRLENSETESATRAMQGSITPPPRSPAKSIT